MSIVKVSPKYQIVIPKDVRERLKIKPGQEVCLLVEEENAVSLVPMPPIEEMEGFLKGALAPAFEREPDRDPTGRVRYSTMLARSKRRRAS